MFSKPIQIKDDALNKWINGNTSFITISNLLFGSSVKDEYLTFPNHNASIHTIHLVNLLLIGFET